MSTQTETFVLEEDEIAPRPELPPEAPAAQLPTVLQPQAQHHQHGVAPELEELHHDELQGMISPALLFHMQRVARLMAESSLIPESLWSTTEGSGQAKKKVALPFRTVLANCFLIVNQARLWRIDCFALAQATSVVHGRLMFEGKVITAVLESTRGIRLKFTFNDQPPGSDGYGVQVEEREPVSLGAEIRKLPQWGLVSGWRTTDRRGGTNKAWLPPQVSNQLAYRGAREWCRLHEPAVILGVLMGDDAEVMSERVRSAGGEEQGEAAAPVMGAGFRTQANAKTATRQRTRKPRFDLNKDEQLVQEAVAAQTEADTASQDAPGAAEAAGGPRAPEESEQPAADGATQDADPFAVFLTSRLPAAMSWGDIILALKALRGTPAWAEEAERPNGSLLINGAYAAVWGRVRELMKLHKGQLVVSYQEDMTAFRAYLEAQGSTQALEESWKGVQLGDVFRAMKPKDRMAIGSQVQRRIRQIADSEDSQHEA